MSGYSDCQGASTLYGPHTLDAYIQEFKKLAAALISGQAVEPGPQPPDLLDRQISLLPPVVVDATPFGVNFGDVKLIFLQIPPLKRVNWLQSPSSLLAQEMTL